MNADGSGLRKVTGTDAELPKWSPDGRKLVFVATLSSVDSSGETVYSNRATIDEIGVDGRSLRVITTTGFTGDVEWSPNGRWIAFDAGGDPCACRANANLEVVHQDGTGVTAASNVDPGVFAWSPDGRRLAFARSVTGHASIYVVGFAPRSKPKRIDVTLGEDVTSLSWSRDGTQIAFVSGSYDEQGQPLVDGHVEIVNADGRGLPRIVSALPHYNGVASGVAWLPGAAHSLLYNTDKGIYIVSLRTGGSHRINSSASAPPVPSPDGKRFLFAPYTSSGKAAIYVQSASASAAHRLT
jgi:Tol biopolymer transport system component